MKAFLSKNQAKYLKSLQQKKYRTQHGRFVAEGIKNLAEALRHPEVIDFVVIGEQESLDFDLSGQNVYLADEKTWSAITTQHNPSGVLAVCRTPNYTEPPSNTSVLVLDGVADPGNLGTLIRICDWFGYYYIHLGLNSVDPFNPKVVQASMGSIFRISFSQGEVAPWLKNRKGEIYAAALSGTSIYNVEFTHPHILVLGSESHGVSEKVLALAQQITIPRYGVCESLNVASAGSIILAEIRRVAPTS